MSARKKKHKHINLLPKQDFEKTTLGRILKWALTTFRFIVIIVELVVVAGFLSRFYLDVRIGDLDEEIDQKAALIESTSRFTDEKNFRRTQAKLSVLSSVYSLESSNSSLVNIISDNTPPDTRIVSISKSGTTTSIVGLSLNEQSISSFITSLNRSEGFTSVHLKRLEKDDSSPFITFSLEVTS